MWYNITKQLQQRVHQLGDMLIGKYQSRTYSEYILFYNLGSGTELSNNIGWPKFNIGNEENNADEGPSTVEICTHNVTDDKSPVPTIEVPDKKMLGSPVKVCFTY